MRKYIRSFEEVGLKDIQLVGGKNASLGEMIRELHDQGIRVPSGFVITADGYSRLVENAGIEKQMMALLSGVDKENTEQLAIAGQKVRALIKQAGLPQDLQVEITQAYNAMERQYGPDVDVAVRSSATAEDLPDASFAGQQESFLNVRGEDALLEACLNCFASLFTDRAIAYRIDKGFAQTAVRLSIGVQKMVRSDLAVSGVMFTLEPETGFRDVVLVTASYGLGENIVAGRVDPDEFVVFKPTLDKSPVPIIRRKLGAKQYRLIYAGHGTKRTHNEHVGAADRARYSVSEEEVLFLSRWACKIERHYSQLYGRSTPMDIEWAKDGKDGHLYIVQARPETVHSVQTQPTIESYELVGSGRLLLKGDAIGQKIAAGPIRVIDSPKQMNTFQDGEVLVAEMTDPDWEPLMKRASAIVTNRGGRTCHAAIISRELGLPCVVGTHSATDDLRDGQHVTVCCAEGSIGYVYDGTLAYNKTDVELDRIPKTRTQIMVNISKPEHAFSLSMLPVDGVGLAREEFIIANDVKVHPLALTRFDQIPDTAIKRELDQLTKGYSNRCDYFIDKLAEGIAVIAAAFFPRPVIVRLSDFKTNEYANLLGGKFFEPKEENPMLGFRGASRYYDERYRDGFELECKALMKVRQKMGLTNVIIMVPFCRTVEEARRVAQEMARNGLVRGEYGLQIYAMCELPSNVWDIDAFCELFDGFSIGSNDLTQLVLGVDRDSGILKSAFDERDAAVKRAIAEAIAGAKRNNRKIGICGQAPSDHPDFAQFLVEAGIDSISLNEDVVLKTLLSIDAVEKLMAARSLVPSK